ncbi:MAG: hypothetical protein LBH26_07450 [Treponema sp.]|nr:hypothetical protein [Treponema sp.]
MTACSEMDTILPSSVSYQVSAVVGKTPVDDYSVIGENDAVRPVFMNSVVNDPDLTGLLMYLQGPEGERLGKKVYYLLKNAESPAEDPYQIPAQDSALSPEEEGSEYSEWDGTGITEQSGEAAANTPEEENNPPKIKTEALNPANEEETIIRVSRLDKDLPVFPFPENLEIGGYSLVFEALGEKQTLYRTERRIYYIGGAKFALEDIQSYLPGLSAGSYLIPPGLTVMLETQVTADERLDPYIVWYDGKRRITEGRIAGGTGRILWEAPAQTGFHTIRAEVFPVNPAALPSGSGNSRTGGRSSVPELRGKVKELALPVSAKGEKPGFPVPETGEILHWYQFAGNLRDSMADGNRGRDLSGREGRDLRWVPSEGIYGLSVQAGETYQLPPSSFVIDEEKQGGGSFLLRVKPLAEGTLLTVSFEAAGSSAKALTMTVVYRERALQLSLESEGLRADASLPLDMFPEDFTENSADPALKDFIVAEAGFYIRENSFRAALGVAGDGKFGGGLLSELFRTDPSAVPGAFPAGLTEIELSAPLSGKISCRLGSSGEQSPRQPARESRAPASETEGEDTVAAAEAAALSAEETAPAALPSPARAAQGPSRTEPQPLAVFDEFALIFRKPARPPNK